MKKIYLVIASILCIFLFPASIAEADESVAPVSVKYDLAYPGILPDSPLYKIKVLRDKISAGLINDPLKKIDFYLLQTDKGILATAMLVDNNKIKLAEETALKAENNYTLLIQQFGKLYKKPNAAFFQKLRTSSLKHQEVLLSLIKRVPKDKQSVFETVLEFSKRNLNQVDRYQNQKSQQFKE